MVSFRSQRLVGLWPTRVAHSRELSSQVAIDYVGYIKPRILIAHYSVPLCLHYCPFPASTDVQDRFANLAAGKQSIYA